ncbi:hypothetical protein TNCV_209741 [Trichonephila clavipes]|uniref:Uncharacterized protein n=1 Tax=Trichonephila clavipes TaxID=2585209 RepID=A0A8X6SUM2_TRICX|nr:hypothetical protein TNCV_209741 [Trichonephila clavipes]
MADMLENTGRVRDRSNSEEYSCHQIHFRFDGRVVNRSCERSLFRQVLMYQNERLLIRLPPHWISFPMQSNRNTSISVVRSLVEVDIRQPM